MGRVFQWSFHNARIRAKIGNLTTAKTFKSVAGNTFDAAIELLEEHPPAGICWPKLSGKNDINVSAALYKSYEDHLVLVGKYLEGNYRKAFLLSLEEPLIDDIKYLIRRIAGGHQGPQREKANYIALTNSSLAEDFSSATTFDDLALALENTPFFKPFNLAWMTYKQTGGILGFEVALDLNYHNRLDRAINKLPEPDRTVTGRLFRKLCDIKNLSWLLRYRFHYKLNEVEIFNYMLEQNFELKDEKVKELAKLNNLSDFLPAIESLNIGAYLISILPSGNHDVSISDIEGALSQYREHILHGALTTSPFGLAPFMVYQWLKVMEKNRFERVVTGLQLELPYKLIVDSLQLYREVPLV